MTSEEEDKNIPRGKDIEKLKSKLLPSSTADPSSNSTTDIQKDTEVTDEPDDPYVSCGFSACVLACVVLK